MNDVLRRLRDALPLLWLGLVLVAAVFARQLPLPDADAQHLLQTLQPPVSMHPFGTDSLGRDVLSRAVLGLRVSLTVGISAVAFGLAFGGLLGLASGYYRGRIDAWASALMAVVLSFPPLVLALAIIAYAGASLPKVILAMGILFVPASMRLVRAQVLRFVDREFVLAARTAGMRDWRIVVQEILPNLLPPLLAYALLMVAIAIIGEASLSFLGLSVPPPQPSLGGMISSERGAMATQPWAVFGPAALLFLTILCLNVVGDHWQRRLDRRGAAL